MYDPRKELLPVASELVKSASERGIGPSRFELSEEWRKLTSDERDAALYRWTRLVFTGPTNEGPVRFFETLGIRTSPYGGTYVVGDLELMLSTIPSDPFMTISSGLAFTPRFSLGIEPNGLVKKIRVRERTGWLRPGLEFEVGNMEKATRLEVPGFYEIKVPTPEHLLENMKVGSPLLEFSYIHFKAFERAQFRDNLLRSGVRPPEI